MRTTTSLWALYLLPSPPRTWGRPDLGGCTGGRGVVIDGVQVQGRVSWVQVGDGVRDARNVPPPPCSAPELPPDAGRQEAPELAHHLLARDVIHPQEPTLPSRTSWRMPSVARQAVPLYEVGECWDLLWAHRR